MGGNLWLRTKTEANLKLELQMKVVMSEILVARNLAAKSAYENYLKSSLEIFQKSLPFREIYVKNLEKNSVQV